MSHPEQQAFVASVRERYPLAFEPPRRRALDVGSLDINGNNRMFFHDPVFVLGVDVVPGANVDLVHPAHALTFSDGFFDTIISTECLEHDLHWCDTLRNCYRMLRSGGLMVLTCAGPGRPEHGTERSKPHDAPGLPWPWYYRNLSADDLTQALSPLTKFGAHGFDRCEATADTYFWGVKV